MQFLRDLCRNKPLLKAKTLSVMQKEIFQRLTRIDQFIRTHETGTPAELADKIGISERSTYEYIRLMKDFGAPVEYSRQRRSYYYKEQGRFLISFLAGEHEPELIA
jgi:predicted DNA-binding transcriptional regulator YafY